MKGLMMGRPTSIGATMMCVYSQEWLALDRLMLEDALLEFLDPQIVFVAESGGDDTVECVGVAEIAHRLKAAREEWKTCYFLVGEIREEGNQVLVAGRLVADLRDSGSRVSHPFAHVWSLGGEGRFVRVTAYSSRVRAIEALAPKLAIDRPEGR